MIKISEIPSYWLKNKGDIMWRDSIRKQISFDEKKKILNEIEEDLNRHHRRLMQSMFQKDFHPIEMEHINEAARKIGIAIGLLKKAQR